MDTNIMIQLNREEQEKLSILAKRRRISVPHLVREWIDKKIKGVDEFDAAGASGLGDVLSSVVLKKSYSGLDSKSAMQKVRKDQKKRL